MAGGIDLRAIALALTARFAQRLAGVGRRLLPGAADAASGAVAKTFRGFLARGMDVLIVCSADDAGMDLIATHLGPGAKILKGKPRCHFAVVHGTDHTFTPRWSQTHLLDLIGARLEGIHGH
jgi:hypothetical protein